MTDRICNAFSLADQMISLAEHRMNDAGIPKSPFDVNNFVRNAVADADKLGRAIHGAAAPARYVRCTLCGGSGADIVEPERLRCPKCGGSGDVYVPGDAR